MNNKAILIICAVITAISVIIAAMVTNSNTKQDASPAKAVILDSIGLGNGNAASIKTAGSNSPGVIGRDVNITIGDTRDNIKNTKDSLKKMPHKKNKK